MVESLSALDKGKDSSLEMEEVVSVIIWEIEETVVEFSVEVGAAEALMVNREMSWKRKGVLKSLN